MPPPTSSNGYGAVNGSGRGANAPGDEEQPLLNGTGRPLKSGWRKSMTTDIRRDWTDLVLLTCYIVTGLLDSASISTWGSFVSMQTGNTVYFGLGIAAPHESTRWIKSGTSLAFFCIGSVFFSSFHRIFSAKRRWVLCASFIVQLLLIVGAAAILTFGPESADPKESIGWSELVPIALIAFQSCGQAVASRALKHNALTSVVLTSIYCDLFSDANLLAAQNVERNRRVAAPLLLLVGAIFGGLLAHSSVGCAGALWVSAALKFGVVIAWFLWPDEAQ
ncbi:hypothetical protein F5B22DRAFT_623811 [Xylaria bambusicola]|uniref:uncharacterized protein n=1 Tax=Xylaria bambusicola TaxID=326684 RepID=UPI002008CF8A|nr:uncharacterized protein F5B22DRAFT_623811 [Xylaria bambusicola]KAI0506470.1 hypothetical protein F5B22DRAFT_623811 [Xylaria bambusicola]